ncbi:MULTISPECIES: substrate-binding domain-containing protein [unclassified Clostridioides]|uniref:substrate-binding domain-containing protein n=1 Tax=unclassified Clostridioides TaxID=2635829 RepID=UPI001D11ED26|nr:substrate-binding domain-containing protein [Clostridioides sp. ZZV14-6150]MCC0660967.1 substrate-binding domain-containing protein [Clostridioides sp. ZZV14-6154]MCC0664354.1 substrate-binding domain-containing protein [Clostridioides sp. ZZV15-6597]MCC0668317.1 substrate-binding domain-containing protein [Clostridioides sp. ZZV14-6153]MCC0720265.1 substrate-binding domain-containing protein [Clostridioides sp. ZZV14-6105]MCC0722612.1 substrate-binding domain-containing protein [Clostridio
MRKILSLGIVATLAVGMLTGCSMDGPSKSEKKDSSAKKDLTIGVSTITLQHQFFIDIDEGIKEKAKELGVKVIVNDPDQDVAKQTSAIEDFIQQDVDGMIVLGTDNSAIVPAVEGAFEKMPVVTVDAVLNTENITSYVGTVSYDAGKKLGEYTKKYIDENLGGKSEIAIVTDLKSQIQMQRIDGFKEALKGSANVKILNSQPGYDREESLNTVENLVQSNPNVDIIYATAENSVLGAKAALESAKNKDVKIVGFDLTDEAATGITDGTVLAMIQQQPKEMGRLAVEAVVKAIKGEKVEKNIPVPALLYDKENIKDFKN